NLKSPMEPRVPGMGGLSGEIVLHRVTMERSKNNAINKQISRWYYKSFKINNMRFDKNKVCWGVV
ncbi:hypothetical protein JW926_11795, partial [Candidatus Sumerlaeota bacterium]|nr:hypothetical protein [Candidatus Sumerlaeota bacterium]